MKRSTRICIGIAASAIAVLVAIAGIFTYLITDLRRGIRFCEEGYTAFARHDHEAALKKYDAALQLRLNNRNYAVAYAGRGAAYNGKQDYDRAIQDLSESIRRFPMPEAFANRGAAFQWKGDFDRAMADYSGAIRLNPNYAWALFNRGRIFRYRNKSDEALADLDEAIRVDSTNAEAFAERGLAYRQKGYLESALASFESALRIDPKNQVALTQRQEIVSPENEKDTSGQRQSEKFYLDQQIAHDLLNRGIEADKNKQYDEAIRLFTEALTYDPEFWNRRAIICNRATAYGRKGERRKAAKDYDEAIKLDPNFVEAYFNRGINNRELGQLDKAIADYTEAIRLNPQYALAYMNRAGIFIRRGEVAKAVTDYDAAVRTIDQVDIKIRAVGLNRLAWMRAASRHKALRNGEESVTLAIKACELTQWKDPAYLDTLATAYAESGHFDEAIRYQMKALGADKISKGDRREMQERLKLYRQKKPYRSSER